MRIVFKKLVKIDEFVDVKDSNGDLKKVAVKIDTGADRTSIDENMAKVLGLLDKDNIIDTIRVRSALGRHRRIVIHLTFFLKGKKIVSEASVTDRSQMSRKMIIGKRDLKNFLVDPSN